jgi:glycerol uptake facilitator-like aquaporin
MMSKYVVEFLGTLFLVFVILTTGNYLAIGAALAL